MAMAQSDKNVLKLASPLPRPNGGVTAEQIEYVQQFKPTVGGRDA